MTIEDSLENNQPFKDSKYNPIQFFTIQRTKLIKKGLSRWKWCKNAESHREAIHFDLARPGLRNVDYICIYAIRLR